MPLIHIRSLPFDHALDIPSILQGISEDFARDVGIAIEHITATWEYLQAEHYAVAGLTARYQPVASHPILVDLLVPAFNSQRTIERMLQSIAQSIAQRVGLPLTNVFINCRCAQSGRVFDGGKLVRW